MNAFVNRHYFRRNPDTIGQRAWVVNKNIAANSNDQCAVNNIGYSLVLLSTIINIICIYSLLSIMVISLIHPHTCGFAKVAAWTATRAVLSETERDDNVQSLKDYESRKIHCIFSKFEENFKGNSNFEIDFKTFKDFMSKFSVTLFPIYQMDSLMYKINVSIILLCYCLFEHFTSYSHRFVVLWYYWIFSSHVDHYCSAIILV